MDPAEHGDTGSVDDHEASMGTWFVLICDIHATLLRPFWIQFRGPWTCANGPGALCHFLFMHLALSYIDLRSLNCKDCRSRIWFFICIFMIFYVFFVFFISFIKNAPLGSWWCIRTVKVAVPTSRFKTKQRNERTTTLKSGQTRQRLLLFAFQDWVVTHHLMCGPAAFCQALAKAKWLTLTQPVRNERCNVWVCLRVSECAWDTYFRYHVAYWRCKFDYGFAMDSNWKISRSNVPIKGKRCHIEVQSFIAGNAQLYGKRSDPAPKQVPVSSYDYDDSLITTCQVYGNEVLLCT